VEIVLAEIDPEARIPVEIVLAEIDPEARVPVEIVLAEIDPEARIPVEIVLAEIDPEARVPVEIVLAEIDPEARIPVEILYAFKVLNDVFAPIINLSPVIVLALRIPGTVKLPSVLSKYATRDPSMYLDGITIFHTYKTKFILT